MSPFFRRRKKPDPDPEPRDAAASDAGGESDDFSDPADSPTLFDVRLAQERKDSEAWHGSWERLSDKVHSFLQRRFDRDKIPFDVEFDDFFSAVVVRMLNDLPTLEVRGRKEFWGWVKKIAANQLVDMWRRHRRLKHGGGHVAQQVDDHEVDVVAGTADPSAQTPSGIFSIRELEGAEEECVSKVANPQLQEIYRMRRRLGMSYEEIASAVGSESADSIRATYSRVKNQVQDCLRRRLDGFGGVLGSDR